MASREILIVESDTEVGPALQRAVDEEAAKGPTHFTLVVPATPPPWQLMWTEGEARDAAEERLEGSLRVLRKIGVDVDGKVGDPRPYDAVNDELIDGNFDAIIVTTPPPALVHPRRNRLHKSIERHYDVPVIHVLGSRSPLRRVE